MTKNTNSDRVISFRSGGDRILRVSVDELEQFNNWSNFSKRNFCIDACKTVFKSIREAPTDYIAIDLCELRFYHCRITLKNGETFYMTKNKYTKEFLKNSEAVRNFGIENYEDDISLADDIVYAALDKYIEFLKSCYAPEKVILIENLPARVHIDEKDRTFYEYSASATASMRNKLLKYYNYFRDHFPGIKIIEFPNGAMGNVNHTWGLDPLHFIDDYYEYLFQAIQIIVSNAAEVDQTLTAIKCMYEKYFDSLLREKRMQYFIERIGKSNVLSSNGKLELSEDNTLRGWEVACSPGAFYDKEHKLLACGGDLDNCWAILSQEIPAKILYGRDVTLSVRFEADSDSYINLALYYKTSGKIHKHIYIYSKKFYSYGFDIVCYDTVKFPASIADDPQNILFAVYTNKKNSTVKLHEIKAEYGKECTLF